MERGLKRKWRRNKVVNRGMHKRSRERKLLTTPRRDMKLKSVKVEANLKLGEGSTDLVPLWGVHVHVQRGSTTTLVSERRRRRRR